MLELYQKIKEEFEAVEGIIQSLCLDQYCSPDAYLSNFELVQSLYLALSELAEYSPELYMGLVRWSSTVAAIGGCLANLPHQTLFEANLTRKQKSTPLCINFTNYA